MIWLLSGEGKSDFGQCNPPTELCEDGQFEFGPMTLVVDKLCLNQTHSSLSVLPSTPGNQTLLFSKQALVELAKSLKGPKSLSLPGGKRRKDGLYFERNAEALAEKAKELSRSKHSKVIAILFRDSDATHSSPRTLWQDQWDSMVCGFQKAGYESGVPMIPKPKSEAWLLCAVKSTPYQHCDKLENESGNDNSPNSLKKTIGQSGESGKIALSSGTIRTV